MTQETVAQDSSLENSIDQVKMSTPENQNTNESPLRKMYTNDSDPASVASTPLTYHSLVTSRVTSDFVSTAATSIYGDGDEEEEEDYDEGTLSCQPSKNPDNGALELNKLDEALEAALREESPNIDPVELPAASSVPNPYAFWECGFGFTAELEQIAAIAGNKAEFLATIEAELALVDFLKKGLTNYNKGIHSGEHHAFSEEFLRKQTLATNITIGQLYQIAEHLKEIINEVNNAEDVAAEVKAELLGAVAHARPWIHRTRAIIVSGHVFYKINYVLDSKKKTSTG